MNHHHEITTTTVMASMEYRVGHGNAHPCQFKIGLAVETAATQTKPAYAGFRAFDFPSVRAGGLGFYSRDFQSLGLKLTPMGNAMPLRTKGFLCMGMILSCPQKLY
jgi:hypothetical protein